MHTPLRTMSLLAALALVLFAAGCDEEDPMGIGPGVDGGPFVDADTDGGGPAADAGPTVDAGPPATPGTTRTG